MALEHFLLIYDLARGELESMARFGDPIEAAEAYTVAERKLRMRDDRDNFEIVLVGADSLDTLKVTHSRYFESGELLPFS
jgi:hypothetical protein